MTPRVSAGWAESIGVCKGPIAIERPTRPYNIASTTVQQVMSPCCAVERQKEAEREKIAQRGRKWIIVRSTKFTS
jgi:hypothetical protein